MSLNDEPSSFDRIDDPLDPRIEAFRALKDRTLARDDGRFIAEGPNVVRRLLESDYAVESVLVGEKYAGPFADANRAEGKLFVASRHVLDEIVGFKFHQGVLACGRRGGRRGVFEVLRVDRERLTLLVAVEVNNAENLGGLIRVAAGLGVDAMVLDGRSCDPFYRQSIRVSMGHVFNLPLAWSDDVVDDLRRLRREYEVECVASVLADDAEPLREFRRSDRTALLVGSEPHGLPAKVVEACDRRVTIPMKLGTDSLNVAVAAGIMLHHLQA